MVNEQVTIKDLYLTLKDYVDRGYGDRKIIISDDNEGNRYHGMFYGVTILGKEDDTGTTDWAKETMYDTVETNPENLAVLG